MMPILNLVEHVCTQARKFLDLGRAHDALKLLKQSRLSEKTGGDRAADHGLLLGEAHLRLRQYKLARTCLRNVLRTNPHDVECLYLLAQAIESDPTADARDAARYYRRAVELAPQDSVLLAAAGANEVQTGHPARGLQLLFRAVELDGADQDALKDLIESLCEIGDFAEARRQIHLARFRFGRLHDLTPMYDLVAGSERLAERRRVDQGNAESTVQIDAARPKRRKANRGKGPILRFDEASKSRSHLGRGILRFDSGRVS